MRVLPILGILMSFCGATAAQPAHTSQTALACANPRAVRALSNPADPRRGDQGWVNFVLSDGRCTNLTAGTAVMIRADNDGIATVTPPSGVGTVLFLRSADLALDAGSAPPAANPIESAPAALPVPAPWQASRPLGGTITCRIDGEASLGHITLAADADHPGVVRLQLKKLTWRIPSGTPIGVTMAFSEGTSLSLSGAGSGEEAIVAIADAATLKPWVHGFTAGRTATITFPGGNEPAWKVDLRGTSPAISAMAACIKDNELNVPPPLGEMATQPFSPIARPPASTNVTSLPPTSVPAVTPPVEPPPTPIVVPPSSPSVPVAEAGFLGTIEEFSSAYRAAANDMVAGATRPHRAAALCASLPGGGVINWIGTVDSLSSNNEGKGVLSIRLNKDVVVRTYNIAFADMSYGTLIPTDSSLFRAVSQLSVGQRVRFSGHLAQDSDDCFKESSLTVKGAMTSPEFIIRFAEVSPAASDTAALLTTLEKIKSLHQEENLTTGLHNPSNSASDGLYLSAVQRGAIGEKVRDCWARQSDNNADNTFSVHLIVTTDASGVARQAEIAPGDPAAAFGSPLHAFGERAVRAVLAAQCSALPLPSGMMGSVHRFDFIFKP